MSGVEIMGAAETIEALGISKPTLARYRTLPGFPKPVELQCGPVWYGRQVRAWRARHPQKAIIDLSDRPARIKAAIKVKQAGGTDAEAAEQAGRSVAAIRKWRSEGLGV